MKTVEGTGFSYHLGDEFAIFEPADAVDELSRDLLEESTALLQEEYHQPFGVIYPRSNRVAIDLLAARELMKEYLPNLVAAANVTADPTTAMSAEYEKTVIDLFPIETFSTMNQAIEWVLKIVREKRREASESSSLTRKRPQDSLHN